jgi:predicted RNA-binding protein Jag
MSLTSEKPAAHTAVKTLRDEAAALIERRNELAAQHLAEQESIRQRVNAIADIQAPLNAKLQERTAILERLQTAQVQLARQKALHDEWLAVMDLAIGQRDAMHLFNLQHLCEVYAGQAGAARVMAEIEGFISRRQAELENLESEIQNYAGQNALGYLLPVSMGGQAPAQ